MKAILDTFKTSLSQLAAIADQANDTLEENTGLVQQAISASARPREAQENLLWWGQARYSRALRKPYRRFQRPEDVAFWAPFEAATICHKANVDVEPASAYVVEVLHVLGQNVDEKRTLSDWMGMLQATLRDAGSKAPTLGERLSKLASEDALALPVTWARLQVGANKGLEGAEDAIALPLDATLDRGQWADWIFRESLLDLHLSAVVKP